MDELSQVAKHDILGTLFMPGHAITVILCIPNVQNAVNMLLVVLEVIRLD